MNLVTGELREIIIEDGVPMAKIRVGGAYLRASLGVLRHAKIGDTILVDSRVAIATIEPDHMKKDPYVPGNTR
jgi:hypothetical protein